MLEDLIEEIKVKLDAKSKKILELINKIDNSKIDQSRTSLRIDENFINLALYSLDDLSHPIIFDFGINSEKEKIFISFMKDLYLLYYESIHEDINLEAVIETLECMLKSEITKNETYINGELVNIDITCSELKINDIEPLLFGIKLKWHWFWKQKELKEHKYKPWLDIE